MASTRKATIAAQIRADRTKFKADLAQATADTRSFRAAASRQLSNIPITTAGGLAGFRQQIGSVIGKYQHLRGVVTDITGLAVRTAGAPAMLNDMKDALTAVTGSATEATQALDFIAGLAEEQKLEFEPLVSAYEHMRALGYSAQQTRDFIREMGNAIETAGGDAADLTAVTAALARIQDTGEMSAKALHSMGQSMPFLRKIMKEQFGADTAAEIQGLQLTMEELFEGILRGLREVETNSGGVLDAMSPEYIASMNRLRAGRAGMGDSPIIPDLPERTAAAADPEGAAKRIQMLRERAAAAKAAAEAEKKLKEATKAEAEAAEQAARDWEEEQARSVEQKKFASDAREEMEIARLRSRGQNKKADKLQQEREDRQRVQELMQEGGLTESAAKEMAAGERRIAEDQEYFDRTGRRKMRGASFKAGFGGIPKYPDTALKDEWNFPALNAAKLRGMLPSPGVPATDEAARMRDPMPRNRTRGGGADPSTGAVEELRALHTTISGKLDELIGNTAKTAGERTAPRHRN